MNVSSFSENSFKVECTRVSGESCPVCIESFSNIDRILKTPCAHLYHVHCLKQWLKTSLYERNVENCAMCRTTLNGLEKKLEKLEKLLCKYNNCCSLVTANKAIDEWDVVEVGYEAIIHFVELCMKNSQVLDSPQDMDTLRKKVDKILIQGIVKNQIPICDQPDTIRFEVAHEWLKLCQQGSEAFTQRSPLNKAELINYIRGNLQTGRRCGFDQRVNELESELNRLLIQGIVKNQIPIYDQPDTIRFEVAHEWLKLCQQGSEAFTQRSPLNKAELINYIQGNLQTGRRCGFDQRVNELESELNRLLIQGIVKNQIPICDQPDTIRFEVAHEWLKLCQQGSEAFTQRSPLNKAGLISYIRGNLQRGRQCGFDQRVNELESELNRLLIQGIVKNQIPIYDQPDTIRF